MVGLSPTQCATVRNRFFVGGISRLSISNRLTRCSRPVLQSASKQHILSCFRKLHCLLIRETEIDVSFSAFQANPKNELAVAFKQLNVVLCTVRLPKSRTIYYMLEIGDWPHSKYTPTNDAQRCRRAYSPTTGRLVETACKSFPSAGLMTNRLVPPRGVEPLFSG